MRCQDTGVSLPVHATIRLPSMKAILRNSFNIASSLMPWEQDGGFGIHGQVGGFPGKPGIRSIMQGDLETGKQKRETGLEQDFMQDIPTC